MNARLITGVFLSCIAVGCDRPSDPAQDANAAAERALAQLRAHQAEYQAGPIPTGEEKRLIELILSRFSGQGREAARLVLMDSVGGGLLPTGIGEVDSMLAKLYALRSESPPVHFSATSEAPRRIPTTIALAPRLSRNGMKALIIRDPRREPADIIVLAESTATGEVLASAVAMLILARETDGEAPTRLTQIAVRSSEPPQSWRKTEVVSANKWMQRLRRASKKDIPGYGELTSLDIPLMASEPGRLGRSLTR